MALTYADRSLRYKDMVFHDFSEVSGNNRKRVPEYVTCEAFIPYKRNGGGIYVKVKLYSDSLIMRVSSDMKNQDDISIKQKRIIINDILDEIKTEVTFFQKFFYSSFRVYWDGVILGVAPKKRKKKRLTN